MGHNADARRSILLVCQVVFFGATATCLLERQRGNPGLDGMQCALLEGAGVWTDGGTVSLRIQNCEQGRNRRTDLVCPSTRCMKDNHLK